MKKQVYIVLLLSLMSNKFKCQSQDFEDLVFGTAFAFNEVYSTFPKSKIRTIDKQYAKDFYSYEVIISDKKSWCTIVAIKISNDYAVILGYAPGISNGLLNGYGEFYLYERKNGQTKQLLHVYEKLSEFSENNTSKQILSKNDIVVVISEKFDVEYFTLNLVKTTYVLPKDYFDYR